MNVSKSADLAFMRELEQVDPKRYGNLMKNIRRDSPATLMSASQALTNFMLGFLTGQFRFKVIAGNTDFGIQEQESPVSHRRAGRPKLRLSRRAQKEHRLAQVRQAVQRSRRRLGVIKNTPVSD